jgi:hypothetical protein
MTLPSPIKVALGLLAIAAVVCLAANHRLYNIGALNPVINLGLASVTVLHLRVKPAWRDALVVAAGATALSILDFKIFHYTFNVFAVLMFAGLASLVTLAICTLWQEGAGREHIVLAFSFAFLSFLIDAAAVPFHALTSWLNPKVLDLYLVSFDASMRVQLSFLMGQAYATWHRFGDAGMFVYIGLPIVLAIVAAGRLLQSRQRALPALSAFLITAPIGIIFYNLFPALGPKYVYGERFPWYPLAINTISNLRLEPIALAGFRNALPSLHIAWVLLAWWYSRGLSVWERAIALIFVVFTVLATLGSGEHYFVDLVVGCPFALFIYGLCAFGSPAASARKTAIAAGLALTLGWIGVLRVAVRLFWLSPLFPWAACAATVGFVLLYQRRLEQGKAQAATEDRASDAVIAAV